MSKQLGIASLIFGAIPYVKFVASYILGESCSDLGELGFKHTFVLNSPVSYASWTIFILFIGYVHFIFWKLLISLDDLLIELLGYLAFDILSSLYILHIEYCQL